MAPRRSQRLRPCALQLSIPSTSPQNLAFATTEGLPTPPANIVDLDATMAPVGTQEHQAVESQLKDVIQDLFQVMVQVNTYDTAGKPTKGVLEQEVKRLEKSIQRVHSTASNPNTALPAVPPELLQYVDNGRNPDIYTREFVELARKGNQLMKGKQEAFASFRDVLAGEMGKALPELREDVGRILDETGGVKEEVLKEES